MNSFTAHQLTFACTVRSPIVLQPHKGSALRGALFHALRGDEQQPNGFCINKSEQFCHRCPHHPTCPISALLATVDDDSPRGVDVPRPYTIEPPLGDQTAYQTGDRLEFGLTLFANALDLFPYVIVGVRQLEVGGIGLVVPRPGPLGYSRGIPGGGRGRGTFTVDRILARNPLTRQERTIMQAGDDMVTVPDIPITNAHVQAAALLAPDVDQVTLEFHTPVRLVDQARLVHRITFVPLLLRLLERLDALAGRYSGSPLEIDRGALLAAADAVSVREDATGWVELMSYSSRMQARSPIGGLIGRVSFHGRLAPFLPWLIWGQFTHIGKDAVKGNGIYRLSWS